MRRIGIFVERYRAWGRQVCEGICAFAQARRDWSLTMLEAGDFRGLGADSGFDGFIARVPNAAVAAALRRTRRPVVDLTSERAARGASFRRIWQNNAAIGELAARHFIEHRFAHFAFCGYTGRRFSDERHAAFARELGARGLSPEVYDCPIAAVRDYDVSTTRHEAFAPAPDLARLVRWLRRLPKPVAIFCANDYRGRQVIEACAAAGIAVPAEAAVLGVDNDTLVCNFVTPTLSSIDPDAAALGEAAAESLARGLAGRSEPAPPRKIAPRELVARASTAVFPVNPPWLSDALVFIRQNIGRHLSAADVYAAIHRSHTRVNAAFRNQLGTTVQAEIRRVALEEARHQLRTTGLPVAEISRRTGFASPQYFCNVFTAAFGQPPTAIRRPGQGLASDTPPVTGAAAPQR